MPIYKSFDYKGEPETCLWCGGNLALDTSAVIGRGKTEEIALHSAEASLPNGVKVLRSYKLFHWKNTNEGEFFEWRINYTRGNRGWDNSPFCTLRCGFQFGKRLAELGRKLVSQA